tara:strand:- start:1691 stop:2464 length:774 start_codon:yes stop_codon:yes gene_type:complete
MATIELLNGERFRHDEILELMKDDKFYYDYLGKAALSSSSIKLLLDSPKKYKYVTEYGSQESNALEAGWLFHTAILEPDVFEKQIYVDVQSKNSKAYKLAKEEHGKVFTIKQKRDAERLADAFLRNEHALKLITNCEFEVPAIDMVQGYPFRGKADVLDSYRVVDLKTTSDLKAFPYAARKYGYDVQVYIYSELFNKPYEEFKFIAIDKGSLDIGIFDVSEEFYNSGKDKVTKALETFETFFINGADLDSYCIKGTL